jgi:hypothetical protein
VETTPEETAPVESAACTSADTEVTIEADSEGSGVGQSYLGVTATNVGDAACVLDGPPQVSFLDESGSKVATAAEGDAAEAVELESGSAAQATLHVSSAGAYDEAECQPVTATAASVLLPGDANELPQVSVNVEVCMGTVQNTDVSGFAPAG